MFEEPDEDFEAWLAGLPPPSASPLLSPAAIEVQETSELRRIRDAERVDWRSAPELPALAARLTEILRAPSGSQALYPIQAAALRCLYDLGACMLFLRTGGGKTLPSFLAAELLQAKRPLLIVPAKLINSGKTHREHAKARAHWRLRPILSAKLSKARALVQTDYMPTRIVSYEALSRVEYADALAEWSPDLIVADEAHKLKSTKSAVTKRLSRYLKAHAETRLFLMSGSFMNRSIFDYQHLLRWCLRDATPLPRNWLEIRNWGYALDNKVADAVRLEPGALLQLSPPEPEDEGLSPRDVARRRYARRLLSTPGVISSGSDMPAVGLVCRKEQLDLSDAQKDLITYLRKNWETPTGHPFELATQLWALEQQAAAGFYYEWDTRPPPEWMTARRDMSAFLREVLKGSRTYDTPLAVINAIDAGVINDYGVLDTWRTVRDLFVPEEHQVARWVCDSSVRYVAQWLHKERGIAWVGYREFGDVLARESGIPYFAAGGKARGVAIDQHKGPAIASVKAVGEGFNLQTLHHKNLVVTCPTTNSLLEQLLSRTHRDGQPEYEVEAVFLQRSEGCEKALMSARTDATTVEHSKMQPQRLTIATWLDE